MNEELKICYQAPSLELAIIGIRSLREKDIFRIARAYQVSGLTVNGAHCQKVS